MDFQLLNCEIVFIENNFSAFVSDMKKYNGHMKKSPFCYCKFPPFNLYQRFRPSIYRRSQTLVFTPPMDDLRLQVRDFPWKVQGRWTERDTSRRGHYLHGAQSPWYVQERECHGLGLWRGRDHLPGAVFTSHSHTIFPINGEYFFTGEKP